MADFSKYIEKSNRLLKVINKWAMFTILFGIIGVIISPYFFTLPGKIDFTKTGDIGSTIGGITAPIVGILSVLLIFISFYAQFHANQLQFRALLDEKEEIEKEKTVRFVELQLGGIRNEWKEFQNSIKIPLRQYEEKPELTKKIIESSSHLNTLNHMLLLIDRIFHSLVENETVHKDLKRRYIFSDFLLILEETSGLFNSLKTVLDKDYKNDPKARFTSEMCDRVWKFQSKISHIANRPENQEEVIKLLEAIEKINNQY